MMKRIISTTSPEAEPQASFRSQILKYSVFAERRNRLTIAVGVYDRSEPRYLPIKVSLALRLICRAKHVRVFLKDELFRGQRFHHGQGSWKDPA
jgi:hypothetical protein